MSRKQNKELLKRANDSIEEFIGDMSVPWTTTFAGLEELQSLIESALDIMAEEHRKDT